jgi:hypothetical protein
MRHLTIAALGSLLCLPASAQRPSPEEQRRTLDAARDTAVHYTSKLPDFICTEQVERTDSFEPNNTRKLDRLTTDRLTIQLTYFGQKEKQKLVAINGSPTTTPLSSLEGLITGGEFGGLQLGVFDASSAADFQWKQATNLRKRPATVYTYRIARAKSYYIVGYRGDNGKMVTAPAGYHGEVVLDNETNRVLRLTAEADDIPKGTDIVQSSVEVDYDFVDVAGHKHLLPSHSESRMVRTDRRITNVVTFTDYHKFEADSTIDFGPPKK